MLRSDCGHDESTKARIAEEITDILRKDGYVRRAAAQAAGGEESWRDLVTPVWLRICASKVDFCALDEEERIRFLKKQARWAVRDLLRPSAIASHTCGCAVGSDSDSIDIPDPALPSEGLWSGIEERNQLEAIVRQAWQAMPPFDRAILALYAGHPCEQDATVRLAERVGLGVAELIARTRSAAVVGRSPEPVIPGRRGGRRGRQGALAGVLGVSPSCLHQWNCRARNLLRNRLRVACRTAAPGTDALPIILERVLA